MSTISLSSDFWTQDDVMELSVFQRIVLIGIATYCDENGAYFGTAKSVKARIFPADDMTAEDIQAAIDAIADVLLFDIDGDCIRFQDWIPFSTFPRAARKRKASAKGAAA